MSGRRRPGAVVPLRRLALLGALWLGSLVAACSPAGDVTGVLPSGQVAPVVKIGSGGTLLDAALYLALARGYFIEQGLTVEVVELPGIASVLAPLVAGQIDVGAVLPGAELFDGLHREHGPPRIVASAARALPGQSAAALVLTPAVAPPTAATLRGKRLATDANTAAGRNAVLALARVGLARDEVSLLDVPLTGAADALLANEAEVAYVLEPDATRLVAQGHARRWVDVDALDPDQDLALIGVSPNVVAHRRWAAERWLAAYLRGQRAFAAALRDPAELRGVQAELARPLGLDDPYRARALATVGYAADPTPNLSSLATLQMYLLAEDLLAARADLERAVDLSFLEAAQAAR